MRCVALTNTWDWSGGLALVHCHVSLPVHGTHMPRVKGAARAPIMLAFAAFAVAHVVGPGRSLARSTVVQRRGMRRTAPVRMPEGPECLVHAQTLEHNLRGRQLRRALVLSGRYAGDGTAGRGGPPEHWDVLQRSLPLTVERVRCHGKFIHWSLVPQAVNTESREAEESVARAGQRGGWAGRG